MKDPLIGRTVTKIRPMTKKEMEAFMWEGNWHGRPVAIVFDDNTVLFASQDPEGNGPGAFFGIAPDGTDFAY